MPQASDPLALLWQNLMDAGCNPKMLARCMALAQEKDNIALLHMLSRHRQALMDTLHQSEKQIDCLDYLIHKLGKTTSCKQFSSGGI